MYDLKTPGSRIRILRTAAGLKQSELAERVGFAQNSISMYESDKYQLSTDLAIKLAVALNTSPAYLLCLTADPEPEPVHA